MAISDRRTWRGHPPYREQAINSRLVLEPLEPRLLLSGDPLLSALPATLAGTPTSVRQAAIPNEELSTLAKRAGASGAVVSDNPKGEQAISRPQALVTDTKYAYWDPEPDFFLADLNELIVTWDITDAPLDATVTSIEYRLWVGEEDAGGKDFYCADYVIAMSSGVHGEDWSYFRAWDQDGGRKDQGYDDDRANDYDIYLDRRLTSAFDGEPVNQEWYWYVGDYLSGDDGNVAYIEFWIEYQYDDNPLPDLQSPSAVWQGPAVREAEAFWVDAEVLNAGIASAGASNLDLWLSTDNDLDTSDDYYLGQMPVAALGPGQSDWPRWNFNMPDLGTGLYDVWVLALADSLDEVAEADEGNNLWLSDSSFKAYDADYADLTTYQFGQWDDKIPIGPAQLAFDVGHDYTGPYYSDEVLYFNWAADNVGDAAAAGYTVHFEVTGGGGGSWDWADITTAAGDQEYLSVDQAAGILTAGTHTFRFWLDYSGVVEELDEADNYYERTITVVDRPSGEIHGTKWHDLNDDGIWDGSEPGLENWQIYLDQDRNGQWDAGEPFALTDATGSYSITELPPDTYIVAEVGQPYWLQTSPGGGGASSASAELSVTSMTTSGSLAPAYAAGNLVAAQDTLVSPQTDTSSPLINMDSFRADANFAGIDGSGFATVILDTGIDEDHPFFGPDDDGDGTADRIVYQWDYAYNDAVADDADGHGSNVSSIVASSDSTYTGMAPGADIISLKVLDDSGSGTFAWIESALQWVATNAALYNIASVNMSLSDGENWTSAGVHYGLGDELAALAAMDVVVVSASGNSFYSYNSVQGVGYPAADPNSLSIGAVYDSDAGGFSYSGGAVASSTGADRIAPFSQRHDTLTTVFAPGAPITGAGATGGLTTYHGTSQASPHIAGIVVLAQQLAVQQLGRRLTFSELTTLLVDTAVTINDGDDEDDNVVNTGLNFPRVDMLALGQAILDMGPVGTHTVVLADGKVVSGMDFGNYLLPVLGDLNSDGRVSGPDLDLVLTYWGQSSPLVDDRADANGDGLVSGPDLDIVLANWGRLVEGGGASSSAAHVAVTASSARRSIVPSLADVQAKPIAGPERLRSALRESIAIAIPQAAAPAVVTTGPTVPVVDLLSITPETRRVKARWLASSLAPQAAGDSAAEQAELGDLFATDLDGPDLGALA